MGVGSLIQGCSAPVSADVISCIMWHWRSPLENLTRLNCLPRLLECRLRDLSPGLLIKGIDVLLVDVIEQSFTHVGVPWRRPRLIVPFMSVRDWRTQFYFFFRYF